MFVRRGNILSLCYLLITYKLSDNNIKRTYPTTIYIKRLTVCLKKNSFKEQNKVSEYMVFVWSEHSLGAVVTA
jgi:hypothetical protein